MQDIDIDAITDHLQQLTLQQQQLSIQIAELKSEICHRTDNNDQQPAQTTYTMQPTSKNTEFQNSF